MAEVHTIHEHTDAYDDLIEFVTVVLDGQMFGVPVTQVQDILGAVQLTKIPTAIKEIAGNLNLRGRIVTAISMRSHLGLPPSDKKAEDLMYVVVEHESDLYSLVVDSVGDVLKISEKTLEPVPQTLDQTWLTITKNVHQLEEELILILDVDMLINNLLSPQGKKEKKAASQ